MTYAPGGKTDAKESVRTATTAALPTNTRSGNILTASANGAIGSIGGVAVALYDRVLVKDETPAANRGIYYVSDLGSAGTPWKLTRSRDADATGKMTSSMVVAIEEGTLADQIWQLTTNGTITVNTTGLTFTRFSDLSLYATLASPALTGTPTAPTAAQGTNTTQLATTAYVQTEAGLLVPKSLVNAKGDLLVGSADNTVVGHAAGANGTVPVFDSVQSDGIHNRLPAAYSSSLVLQASGNITAGVTSQTRLMTYEGALATVGTDTKQSPFLYWSGSAFDVADWNQEILILFMLQTNATAPASDFTFTLRAVTANAGGAGVITTTLGAAFTGSTITISAPVAGGMQTANSGWIAAPAANSGFYAPAIANSATIAASATVRFTALIFQRYVN